MTTWPCEAYGPEGIDVGALCFLTPETGKRACATRDVCAANMRTERDALFRRIHELAATDSDPVWADLAAEFPTPDTLLGGIDGGTP